MITLLIDPTAPRGHRVAACKPLPPGVGRQMLIDGLPMAVFAIDGNAGDGWSVGRHVLTGRVIVALPGCDDQPETFLRRWLATLRFPAGRDASRLGCLIREAVAEVNPKARDGRMVEAGKRSAEIADILSRAEGAV